MLKWFPLLTGIFVFVIDFISKSLTHAYLPLMNRSTLWYPYGGVGMFKNFFGVEFSLSHQINYGAAWGIFADHQMYLLYLRLALVAGLIVYACFFNKHTRWSLPLALIIAGALGNVADYFIYGHVVDMFHFVLWGYDFPVFNIADTSIFLGIASLIIVSSMEKEGVKKQVSKGAAKKR